MEISGGALVITGDEYLKSISKDIPYERSFWNVDVRRRLHIRQCAETPAGLWQQLPGLRGLVIEDCNGNFVSKSAQESFLQLTELQHLAIINCSSLTSLSVSIGSIPSLRQLDIQQCSHLNELPNSIGQLSALQALNLQECSQLRALPESTGQLCALHTLDLQDCSRLVALPDSVGQLSALETLNLQGCSQLRALPESVGQLSALKTLNLQGCSQMEALPESVGQLSALKTLNLQGCSQMEVLPESVGQLSALKTLNLQGCSQMEALPNSIGQLSTLQTLNLQECILLTALPESSGQLSSLQVLNLQGCRRLTRLPESLALLLQRVRIAYQLVDHAHTAAAASSAAAGTTSHQNIDPDPITDYNNPSGAPEPLHHLPELLQDQHASNMDQHASSRRLCGAHDDSAATRDALNIQSAARGASRFLLHPDTAATTLAINGRWGAGKSTFMKMIEQDMVMESAYSQLVAMDAVEDCATEDSTLHKQYETRRQQILDFSHRMTSSDTERAMNSMAVLASPRLMTVSFNAWQYLNEDQVWGGLIVEVTQRLEEKLAWAQRMKMREWWHGKWMMLLLVLWWANGHIAIRYNWRKRRSEVLLRFILPVVVVLSTVVPLAAWGSQQLSEMAQQGGPGSKGLNIAAVLTAVAGAFTAIYTVFDRTSSVVKMISDVMLEGKNFLTLKDYSDKIGYQHAVIKDLKLLKSLLEQETAWLAAHKVARHPYRDKCSVEGQEPQQQQQQQQPPDGQQLPMHSIRVVVFIDDLDRCKPSKVVEVLEAVHMVLANSGFSVVIGMDKEFVCNAISQAYKESLISTETAEEFLQKIVQVELTLPRPSQADLSRFLASLGMNVEVVVDDQQQPSPQSPEQPAQEAAAVKQAEGDKRHDVTPPPAAAPAPIAAAARAAAPAAAAPVAVAPADVLGSSPMAIAPKDPKGTMRQRRNRAVQLARERYFTPVIESVLQCALKNEDDVSAWLFAHATPRDIKRLMNQYLLATYILTERMDDQQQREDTTQRPSGFDDEQQRQLMAWCLLWWRYPRGMQQAVQYIAKQPNFSGLQQLVQQALEYYQPVVAATEAPAAAAEASKDAGKASGSNATKLQRLEVAVNELKMIYELVSCEGDAWCLSVKGCTSPCHKKQLWDISSAAVKEFRLFGMEVLSNCKDGDDLPGSAGGPATPSIPQEGMPWARPSPEGQNNV